jgi:glycosyltransferase involved in cell wall biosynthesis
MPPAAALPQAVHPGNGGRPTLLVSAYACEPGKGSEPGLGWKMPSQMAFTHEVWVVTRANNRSDIEAELARRPVPNLRFVYFDLPRWAAWWKRGQRGIQLYYYLWQIGAYLHARRMLRHVDVGVVHHVTFVKYWMPSLFWLLPRPFIWGPVGGAESAPPSFVRDFGWRGRLYEAIRSFARTVGDHDPLVRLTARRSTIALATTQETAARLRVLGCRDVRVLSESGVSQRELEQLARHAKAAPEQARFISIGRLLHWKGFHLAIRAFARLDVPDAEYLIVGSGPERRALERLTHQLGVADRVHFLGEVERQQAFARLGESTALVHPSLHDSGGMVCLEAMACARPVICLDLGGPATQVTDDAGLRIPAVDPERTVLGFVWGEARSNG